MAWLLLPGEGDWRAAVPADLAAYLGSLAVGKLAELLSCSHRHDFEVNASGFQPF